MNHERKRLPDIRQGFTKKLTVTHVHPIGTSTSEVLLALKNLVAVRDNLAATTGLADTGDCGAALAAARTVLDKYSKEQIVVTKLYITTGCYPDDGQVGEIFLKADRMGSTISGLLDALSMSLSVGLQSGVPLRWFTDKLKSMRFEPSGTTSDPKMPRITSLMDGLARWLERQYITSIQPPDLPEERT